MGPDVGSFKLSIGGLRMELSSPIPFVSSLLPSEYRTFCDLACEGDPALHIRMSPGIPDMVGWGTFVQSSRTWRLFRDQQVRRLVWDGRDPGHPLWILEFVPGAKDVIVHCGDRLLEDVGGSLALRNPMHYPLDQMILMYQLIARDQCIVHSAGLILEKKCIVAAGRSGAGKSTLSRCWAARHGDASLLSDDRMIIGGMAGEAGIPVAYGSPWPGELGAASNDHRPVGALVFLVKARENRLVPLDSREAVERLFPLTSIPWFDAEYLTLALSGIERWVVAVPLYELQFTPEEGAVRALEELSRGPGWM